MAASCPFCPPPESRVFAREGSAVALWDGFPVAPGHALIIPLRHVPSWFEATDEERRDIVTLLDRAREVVAERERPDGWNVGMNLGAAAGQTVPHLHVHLIPRRAGDVEDPRGGVRWVVPEKADYWTKR